MVTNQATTEEQLVYTAICAIAARCDGAISQDGIGFNGSDTKFGRRIAAMPFEEWTPEITTEAARILGNTYRVQAQGLTGIDARQLQIVRDASEHYTNHVARDQARQAEKRATAASKRHVDLKGTRLSFVFPFDATIKDELKAAGCRFNGSAKSWDVDAKMVDATIVGIALTYGFRFNDEVDALLDAAKDVVIERHTGSVSVRDNGTMVVTLEGRLDGAAFSEYRSLDGYHWDGGKVSTVEITARNIDWLTGHDFTGAEWGRKVAADKVEASRAAQEAAEARLEASRKAESDLDLSSIVPEGLAPYGYQVAGVEYALANRRVMIGDEMGLGKTVQAILAVEAAKRGM